MKDGKKERRATKQAWHHRQFNGSNEKGPGGGRVPHSLARAGLVLPQGRREAGITSQEHSAQSVNVNKMSFSKGPSKERGRAWTRPWGASEASKGPEGLKEKHVRREQRREPVASSAGKEKDRRTGKFKNKRDRRIQGKRGQEEKRRTEEQNESKKKARRARVPAGRRSCRRRSEEKEGPGGQLRRQQRKKSRKKQQHQQKEGARVLRKEGRRCSKGIFEVGSHGGSKRGAERKQGGSAGGGAGRGWRSERNEFICIDRRGTLASSGNRRHGARPPALSWTRCGRNGRMLERKEFVESMEFVEDTAALERPRSSRGGHSLIGNHRRSGSRS